MTDIITVTEAAKLLGVSRRRIYDYAEQGWLEEARTETGYLAVTKASVQKAQQTPYPRQKPGPRT